MTDASVLDPIARVELMGHRLDLGRPELRPLMNRYVSDPVRSTPGLLDPPTALVVTRPSGDDEPVRDDLEERGWSVATCGGPGARDCPVLRGRACPLRGSVDVAIVYVAPGAPSLPRLRCAADSASPGLVAVEGSDDAPRYRGRTAVAGASCAPEVITAAVRELLEREAGTEEGLAGTPG